VNENSANLAIYSDYTLSWGSQELTNILGFYICRADNTIAYNIFDGDGQTSVGYKEKGMQYLESSIFFEGEILNTKEFSGNGNKIHHNIFLNHIYCSAYISSDFSQVNNNICVMSEPYLTNANSNLHLGYTNRDERPPSDIVAYNNTVKGGYRGGIEFKPHTTSESTYWNNCFAFNNIVERSNDSDSNQDITFIKQYTNSYTWDIDNKIVANNNYFYNPTNTSLIRVLGTSYDLAGINATAWAENNRSHTHSAVDSLYSGISGVDQFILNPEYTDWVSVSSGGYGQTHPYLPEVTIPSYIGAVNPADDDWVDGVLTLNVAYMTAAIGDPAWIEGTIPNSTPQSTSNYKNILLKQIEIR